MTWHFHQFNSANNTFLPEQIVGKPPQQNHFSSKSSASSTENQPISVPVVQQKSFNSAQAGVNLKSQSPSSSSHVSKFQGFCCFFTSWFQNVSYCIFNVQFNKMSINWHVMRPTIRRIRSACRQLSVAPRRSSLTTVPCANRWPSQLTNRRWIDKSSRATWRPAMTRVIKCFKSDRKRTILDSIGIIRNFKLHVSNLV